MKLINLSIVVVYICASLTYRPIAATGDPCGGSGWIAYKDIKCFYPIWQYATRNEAQSLCKQLGSGDILPTLVMIKTAEEQKFLEQYLFGNLSVTANIWLGAKRSTNLTALTYYSPFLWDDGTPVEFSDWSQNSPSNDDTRECVQLVGWSQAIAINSTAGLWSDVTCELRNFAICQKFQKWTFDKLQKFTLDLQFELERTRAHLVEVERNPVPIGFIYVQFPKDLSPKEIWPWMTWTSVSPNYAGYFFRVEGGDAAPFGVEQNASQSGITRVLPDYYGGNYDHELGHEVSLKPGTWSGRIPTGHDTSAYMYWQLYTSQEETRPINMAMKIWKRIA